MTHPSADRQQTAQMPPPRGLDLALFPASPIATGTPLQRAHDVRRGPWWFGSSMQGRFDLSSPRGTCYAADEIAAAMRERLGQNFVGGGRAPASLVDATVVTEIIPPGGRAVELEAEGVAAYPVTGELVAMADHAIPQAWATAFDAAGYAGIHYRGRFSHSYGVVCWALFDEAGGKTYGTGSSVGGREACARAEIMVMPAPPTDVSTLRVVPPPG